MLTTLLLCTSFNSTYSNIIQRLFYLFDLCVFIAVKMDEFFPQRARDLEEANFVVREYTNNVAVLREKCCDLELSLAALHDPDCEVKLYYVKNITSMTSHLSRAHIDMEVRDDGSVM